MEVSGEMESLGRRDIDTESNQVGNDGSDSLPTGKSLEKAEEIWKNSEYKSNTKKPNTSNETSECLGMEKKDFDSNPNEDETLEPKSPEIGRRKSKSIARSSSSNSPIKSPTNSPEVGGRRRLRVHVFEGESSPKKKTDIEVKSSDVDEIALKEKEKQSIGEQSDKQITDKSNLYKGETIMSVSLCEKRNLPVASEKDSISNSNILEDFKESNDVTKDSDEKEYSSKLSVKEGCQNIENDKVHTTKYQGIGDGEKDSESTVTELDVGICRQESSTASFQEAQDKSAADEKSRGVDSINSELKESELSAAANEGSCSQQEDTKEGETTTGINGRAASGKCSDRSDQTKGKDLPNESEENGSAESDVLNDPDKPVREKNDQKGERNSEEDRDIEKNADSLNLKSNDTIERGEEKLAQGEDKETKSSEEHKETISEEERENKEDASKEENTIRKTSVEKGYEKEDSDVAANQEKGQEFSEKKQHLNKMTSQQDMEDVQKGLFKELAGMGVHVEKIYPQRQGDNDNLQDDISLKGKGTNKPENVEEYRKSSVVRETVRKELEGKKHDDTDCLSKEHKDSDCQHKAIASQEIKQEKKLSDRKSTCVGAARKTLEDEKMCEENPLRIEKSDLESRDRISCGKKDTTELQKENSGEKIKSRRKMSISNMSLPIQKEEGGEKEMGRETKIKELPSHVRESVEETVGHRKGENSPKKAKEKEDVINEEESQKVTETSNKKPRHVKKEILYSKDKEESIEKVQSSSGEGKAGSVLESSVPANISGGIENSHILQSSDKRKGDPSHTTKGKKRLQKEDSDITQMAKVPKTSRFSDGLHMDQNSGDASSAKTKEGVESCLENSSITETKVECINLSSDEDGENCRSPPKKAISMVCKKCCDIWNDRILHLIFEGTECVTVNSKITYGAIVCINSWINRNLTKDKEEAMINVFERADLGKNIAKLNISQLDEWLDDLLHSGKNKCCDIFTAVYGSEKEGKLAKLKRTELEKAQVSKGKSQVTKEYVYLLPSSRTVPKLSLTATYPQTVARSYTSPSSFIHSASHGEEATDPKAGKKLTSSKMASSSVGDQHKHSLGSSSKIEKTTALSPSSNALTGKITSPPQISSKFHVALSSNKSKNISKHTPVQSVHSYQAKALVTPGHSNLVDGTAKPQSNIRAGTSSQHVSEAMSGSSKTKSREKVSSSLDEKVVQEKALADLKASPDVDVSHQIKRKKGRPRKKKRPYNAKAQADRFVLDGPTPSDGVANDRKRTLAKGTELHANENGSACNLPTSLDISAENMNIYSSYVNEQPITNSMKVKKPSRADKMSPCYFSMLRERSALNGSALNTFDLLLYEPNNQYSTSSTQGQSKNRFVTKRELLTLQSIFILNPEVPDVDLFYQVFIEILLSRKRVLLIPDCCSLMVVTENIRKEYNRAKSKDSSVQFLNEDWDPYSVYSAIDLWLDGHPPKEATIRDVLSVFCTWKSLKKKSLDESLLKALHFICKFENAAGVDHFGICFKLYARLSRYLYEKGDVELAESFLNKIFKGSDYIVSKRLVEDVIVPKKCMPDTLDYYRDEGEIIENVIDKCEMLERRALLSLKKPVLEDLCSGLAIIKEKFKNYTEENQILMKRLRTAVDKRGKMLKRIKDPRAKNLIKKLRESLMDTHKAFEKRQEEQYACERSYKKQKICSDGKGSVSTVACDESVPLFIVELIKDLLSKGVKANQVRHVVDKISVSVCEKKLLKIPSDKWIENFAASVGSS